MVVNSLGLENKVLVLHIMLLLLQLSFDNIALGGFEYILVVTFQSSLVSFNTCTDHCNMLLDRNFILTYKSPVNQRILGFVARKCPGMPQQLVSGRVPEFL